MKLTPAVLLLAKLATCQPDAQQSSEPEADADAHAIDGNIKGSSMCRTISNNECNLAIGFFNDTDIYHEHTSLAVAYNHGIIIDTVSYVTGCKAEWYCDNEEDYKSGMSGKGIKDA